MTHWWKLAAPILALAVAAAIAIMSGSQSLFA